MFRNASYVDHFRVLGKRKNILRERKFRVTYCVKEADDRQDNLPSIVWIKYYI